jgi:ATP-dependent RNA helicase HelY
LTRAPLPSFAPRPPVQGVDPATLPQELTKVYVDLVALRLRAGEPDAAAARDLNLDRLLRIASIYEAVADTGSVVVHRRAAAFVAATAYQIVGRVGAAEGVQGSDLLRATAIHPLVAAPLLFLISGQSPDAREAGRRSTGTSCAISPAAGSWPSSETSSLSAAPISLHSAHLAITL